MARTSVHGNLLEQPAGLDLVQRAGQSELPMEHWHAATRGRWELLRGRCAQPARDRKSGASDLLERPNPIQEWYRLPDRIRRERLRVSYLRDSICPCESDLPRGQ